MLLKESVRQGQDSALNSKEGPVKLCSIQTVNAASDTVFGNCFHSDYKTSQDLLYELQNDTYTSM